MPLKAKSCPWTIPVFSILSCHHGVGRVPLSHTLPSWCSTSRCISPGQGSQVVRFESSETMNQDKSSPRPWRLTLPTTWRDENRLWRYSRETYSMMKSHPSVNGIAPWARILDWRWRKRWMDKHLPLCFWQGGSVTSCLTCVLPWFPHYGGLHPPFVSQEHSLPSSGCSYQPSCHRSQRLHWYCVRQSLTALRNWHYILDHSVTDEAWHWSLVMLH